MMMQEQEKGKGQGQSGAAGESPGQRTGTGVNHSRLFFVGSRLRKAPRNQGRGHGL